MRTKIIKSVTGWELHAESVAQGRFLCNKIRNMCPASATCLQVTDRSGKTVLQIRAEGKKAEIEKEGATLSAGMRLQPYTCAWLPDKVTEIRLENGLTLTREPGGWSIQKNDEPLGEVRFGLLAHQMILRDDADCLPEVFALVVAAEESENLAAV